MVVLHTRDLAERWMHHHRAWIEKTGGRYFFSGDLGPLNCLFARRVFKSRSDAMYRLGQAVESLKKLIETITE